MSETRIASEAAIISAAVRPATTLPRYNLASLNALVERAVKDMSDGGTVRYVGYSRTSTITFAGQALDNVRDELEQRRRDFAGQLQDVEELQRHVDRHTPVARA